MPAELHVSISDELAARLNELAHETNCSKDELVADALHDYVEGEGAWLKEMADRMNNPDRLLVPHEEVVAWIESLGTANPLPRPAGRRLAF